MGAGMLSSLARWDLTASRSFEGVGVRAGEDVQQEEEDVETGCGGGGFVGEEEGVGGAEGGGGDGVVVGLCWGGGVG